MIDAKALLDRFLGPGGLNSVLPGGSSGPTTGGSVPQAGVGASGSSLPGGFLGGTAAGGLLGLMLGNKKLRKKAGKLAGGAVGYGGAAVLGALAYRAWQNWQQGQSPAAAPATPPTPGVAVDARFMPDAAPAADGQPFELALVRAMIGAAKADGHIDAEEQRAIFSQVERAGLDAEAKAFVFDALAAPVSVDKVAAAARTQEQAAELYLASRLAIDPDEPSERAYLEALAHRLSLPRDLVAHLDRQAEAGLAAPAPGSAGNPA